MYFIKTVIKSVSALQCSFVVLFKSKKGLTATTPTSSSPCQYTIRHCMNCTYNLDSLLWTTIAVGCVENWMLEAISTKDRDMFCYNLFVIKSALAAEYQVQEKMCYIYFCEGGLSFAEGRVTYARTCQTGHAFIFSSLFNIFNISRSRRFLTLL